MDWNQTVLYEDFQRAQSAAVEVTDRYLATPDDDPRRDALWREVVLRTEKSHTLLKRWLAEVGDSAREGEVEPELVLSR